LNDNNKELISKILKRKESKDRVNNGTSSAYPGLNSTGTKRGRLSPAQKRVYVLCQMSGKNDIAYNLPEVLQFNGELSREQVQNAIQRVIRRHDILRTSFIIQDGEIYQEVHDATHFHVDHVKLSSDQFDGWLKNYISPFDLTIPCQLRSPYNWRWLFFRNH